MCEIFGICSQERYVVNKYLKEFYSHSNMHPHGWGLACMEENEVFIEKEPMQASKSCYLKARLSSEIRVSAALAHIRYATIGNVEYVNCHPYTGKDLSGRRWTLIHNGTIFEYSPLNKYLKVQTGNTDSERILLHIIEKIDERQQLLLRPLQARERFRLLDSIFVKMSEGNKLNLLIYDGELMYIHTNYAKSLHYLERQNCILFSTEPLCKEDWKPVPFTTLMACEEGKWLFTGTNHHNEYEDNEENLKYLYQIYSSL